MLVSELYDAVLTRADLAYNAYLTEGQWNELLNSASVMAIESFYSKYLETKKGLGNLHPLVIDTGAISPTTSSTYILPSDTMYEISLKTKYAGNVDFRETLLQLEGQHYDVFNQPTIKEPVYYYNYSGTNKIIVLEPSGVTQLKLLYLANPTVIDITGSPTTNLKYGVTLLNKIIDYAIILYKNTIREDETYQIDKDIKSDF